MATPDADRIRDTARERVADRPNLVIDGDPIEELAKAHDRHAERLDAIVRGLRDVGQVNHLGDTTEGRAATNNLRVAAHEDPRSVATASSHQADSARGIAEVLRAIRSAINLAEESNTTSIAATQR